MYFLDTNTCIYFLNGTHENIKNRILSTIPAQIQIPAIVKSELLLGAYKSKKKQLNTEKVEHFLQPFEIIPFEDMMSYIYAEIRYDMEKKGTIIGPNDLFIASIVKYHNGILVTNNIKEFERVKGLKVDNWI